MFYLAMRTLMFCHPDIEPWEKLPVVEEHCCDEAVSLPDARLSRTRTMTAAGA